MGDSPLYPARYASLPDTLLSFDDLPVNFFGFWDGAPVSPSPPPPSNLHCVPSALCNLTQATMVQAHLLFAAFVLPYNPDFCVSKHSLVTWLLLLIDNSVLFFWLWILIYLELSKTQQFTVSVETQIPDFYLQALLFFQEDVFPQVTVLLTWTTIGKLLYIKWKEIKHL